MDTKLFNLKYKNNITKTKLSIKELQSIIEDNITELLGLRLIESNYVIDKDSNEFISTLAIDSEYRLVIIEYRSGKFSRVIQNGLSQIDYINDHLSIFKLLCHDKFGDNNRRVNYNARLIVIGEAFHKTDANSVSKIPYDIDLIKYELFDREYLSLIKTYTSRNIDLSNFNYDLDNKQKEIVRDLVNYAISLGEEVTVTYYNKVISFKKIKTFMKLDINNPFILSLCHNNKAYIIKEAKDVEKYESEIEEAYDLL